MPAQKQLFVLWSGGIDSTFLIQEALANPNYQKVQAGYVRVHNNPDKTRAEIAAIERMLPLLGQHTRFTFVGPIVDVDFSTKNPNLRLRQIPIWLLAAVAGADGLTDEIALGYVMNDDAISFIEDIRRAYYAYQPFMHRRLPRLVFPLIKHKKSQIFAALDPALRGACISCEHPTPPGEPCGTCPACLRRASYHSAGAYSL